MLFRWTTRKSLDISSDSIFPKWNGQTHLLNIYQRGYLISVVMIPVTVRVVVSRVDTTRKSQSQWQNSHFFPPPNEIQRSLCVSPSQHKHSFPSRGETPKDKSGSSTGCVCSTFKTHAPGSHVRITTVSMTQHFEDYPPPDSSPVSHMDGPSVWGPRAHSREPSVQVKL